MNKFAKNPPTHTTSQTGTKTLRIGELLIAAEIIKSQDLDESLKIAKTSKTMIGRTLVTLGQIDEQKLAAALELQNLMRNGLVNTQVGIKALKIACAAKISIDDALKSIGWKSLTSPQIYTDENELTKLLLESGLINKQLLQSAEKQSKENNLSLGRCLIINRHMNQQKLETILSLISMVKENQISLDQALKSLHSVLQKNQPIENALFAFGIRPLQESDRRIANLLCLAGFITDLARLTVWEQSLTENIPIGALLVQSDMVKADLIEKALHLQKRIIEGSITLNQAADILKKAQTEKLDIEALLVEINKKGRAVNQIEQVLDLLVATGLISEKTLSEAKLLASQTKQPLGEAILSLQNIELSHLEAAWQAKTMIDDKIINLEFARNELRKLYGTDKASSQNQTDLPSQLFEQNPPEYSQSLKVRLNKFIAKLFSR